MFLEVNITNVGPDNGKIHMNKLANNNAEAKRHWFDSSPQKRGDLSNFFFLRFYMDVLAERFAKIHQHQYNVMPTLEDEVNKVQHLHATRQAAISERLQVSSIFINNFKLLF